MPRKWSQKRDEMKQYHGGMRHLRRGGGKWRTHYRLLPTLPPKKREIQRKTASESASESVLPAARWEKAWNPGFEFRFSCKDQQHSGAVAGLAPTTQQLKATPAPLEASWHRHLSVSNVKTHCTGLLLLLFLVITLLAICTQMRSLSHTHTHPDHTHTLGLSCVSPSLV